MLRLSRLIPTLIIILSAVSIGFAQDDSYADMAKSRADDGAFILGDSSAEVKIIEFSDFLCPHCQDYHPIIKTFIDNYVATGQAQFEYRMLPIVNTELSTFASNLVECADIQSEGLFWQAHDVMFDLMSSAQFSQTTVTNFADQLGLDETTLTECTATASQIQTDTDYAISLGVRGTPTVAVQYGDADPVFVLLPQQDQFEAIVNAKRPVTNEVVTIEDGRYAGIPTYRTDDGGIVLGDPSAPLHIVAFEDFMCPHCQNYQTTVHEFVDKYVSTGQAKFEYRFYPLVNPDFSMLTANVADCIALQDLSKFWDAHDLIYDFASSDEIDEQVASVVSMLVGVDSSAVEACVDTTIQPLIDVQLGRSAEVTGTPGIRARNADGELEIIYAGQQSLERGAIPVEVLAGLAEGSPDFSIGQPEISLLNDNFLNTDALLTSEPCGIPCWENIIPGETTIAEAQAIVSELEPFTVVQEDANSVVFTTNDFEICCRIMNEDNSGNPNSVVGATFLQLAPNTTLGQFVETHGDPEFVSGEPYSDNEAVMTLFYPELNTILNVIVPGEAGQLSEESPIFAAIFTSEPIMSSAISNSPLDNWKGYLTYIEYMDGEFDNNP